MFRQSENDGWNLYVAFLKALVLKSATLESQRNANSVFWDLGDRY